VLSRRQALAGIAAAACAPFRGRASAAASANRLAGIANLLGIDRRYAGAGLSFDIGAVYPVTGAGGVYGAHVTDIPKLAFRHIAAMGGPELNLILKDNRSGDPQAGAQAVRELGFAKVPMMLSSYSADIGAMLSGIERYHILSIDGSGGTSIFARNKPYFWGSIATTPNDALSGVIAFLQAAMPAVVTISTIGWDLGSLGDMVVNDATRQFSGTDFKLGTAEKSRIGSTDYSASLLKIKNSAPDFVLCVLYGEDLGYFMKQYALAGIEKPVMAFTHSIVAEEIAGPAYDGLYFAFDYFDAAHPSNPWAQFYIDEFYDLEGTYYPPDNYGANAYEDVFTLWACIRRVIEAGGDPHDGAQLDAALRAHPTFPSLYGGDGAAPGTLTLDLATHSVAKRPMTIAQFKDGTIVPLAHFQTGGVNFSLEHAML
jgi:ABC-type branched-subunit amino acid transport system substrate-binding protein